MHRIWQDVVNLRSCVFVKRVSTKLNIADLPSRPTADSLRFMNETGAVEVEPQLAEDYCSLETWEVLHERLQVFRETRHV